MKPAKSALDAAFIEGQRQSLLRLRATLIASTKATEADAADVQGQRAGTVGESEDDAQGLDALERDDNLVGRDLERLERIERALRKIEEGTYGLSDESGAAIPRNRLEAVPDALYTVSEERAREPNR
jgi:DnaK suppressor protein